jgi:signal transduction histidine kinase
MPGRRAAIGVAAERRMPVQIPDVRNDPLSPVLDVIVRAGFRALLTVPLVGADRIVGALVVRRKAQGEFPKHTVDLLQTFAAQSVLAIQNANLFTEVEEKSRQLQMASEHKSQFVASMSHELRTPIKPDMPISGIRLSDQLHREAQRHHRSDRDDVHQRGALRHGKSPLCHERHCTITAATPD